MIEELHGSGRRFPGVNDISEWYNKLSTHSRKVFVMNGFIFFLSIILQVPVTLFLVVVILGVFTRIFDMIDR